MSYIINLRGTRYNVNHLLCGKHSKRELRFKSPCDTRGVPNVISLVIADCRWILAVIGVARPHLSRGLFRELFTGLKSGK